MGRKPLLILFIMTKKELLIIARQYFDSNDNRKEIFATEDKHFFNAESDARYYCKDEKKYYHITISDFLEAAEEAAKKEEAVSKEAKAAKEKIEEDKIGKEEAAKKESKNLHSKNSK